jgi:hypothetical protein
MSKKLCKVCGFQIFSDDLITFEKIELHKKCSSCENIKTDKCPNPEEETGSIYYVSNKKLYCNKCKEKDKLKVFEELIINKPKKVLSKTEEKKKKEEEDLKKKEEERIKKEETEKENKLRQLSIKQKQNLLQDNLMKGLIKMNVYTGKRSIDLKFKKMKVEKDKTLTILEESTEENKVVVLQKKRKKKENVDKVEIQYEENSKTSTIEVKETSKKRQKKKPTKTNIKSQLNEMEKKQEKESIFKSIEETNDGKEEEEDIQENEIIYLYQDENGNPVDKDGKKLKQNLIVYVDEFNDKLDNDGNVIKEEDNEKSDIIFIYEGILYFNFLKVKKIND